LGSSIPDAPIREHCSAHRSQITTIGRNKGQQVRIERYAPDGVTRLDFALYTVVAVHDEEPDVVFVGYRDPESTHHDLRDRLGLSSTDPVTGKINSQVPHPTLENDKVKENSEFVERLTDNGRHRGLIVIAPHGGDIERHTDEQAEHVGKRLSSKCVSVWVCKGFKKDGGAFDRWHITSTDISEESFPKLKTVIGRRFEYAVAFHGWDEDSICIGGSAPADLKQQIKTAVENAIAGSATAVLIRGHDNLSSGLQRQ
ncbi:MAG: poly-gamma-glutamate hydrolase family protein, partial [Acidobacteria bacterium]|nr:poly-gamma-glutamate hydrolase family protein [Acidobacteriota bacterium]